MYEEENRDQLRYPDYRVFLHRNRRMLSTGNLLPNHFGNRRLKNVSEELELLVPKLILITLI